MLSLADESAPCFSLSFPKGMVQLNRLKTDNSVVVLADGYEIGRGEQGLSYTDLRGVFGNLISGIRSHRTNFLLQPGNHDKPIPPCPPELLEELINGVKHRYVCYERISPSPKVKAEYASAVTASESSEQSGSHQPCQGYRSLARLVI